MQKLIYAPFYAGYVSRFRGDNVPDALELQLAEFKQFIRSIPESKTDFSYAPGKWNIVCLLLHIVDAERVFAYRALCISRGETQNLNDMDQDKYAAHSNSEARSITGILSEFNFVRKSSISLFKSLNSDQWSQQGTVNHSPINVKALGHIIYGHCDHHMEILKTRYLESQ